MIASLQAEALGKEHRAMSSTVNVNAQQSRLFAHSGT